MLPGTGIERGGGERANESERERERTRARERESERERGRANERERESTLPRPGTQVARKRAKEMKDLNLFPHVMSVRHSPGQLDTIRRSLVSWYNLTINAGKIAA